MKHGKHDKLIKHGSKYCMYYLKQRDGLLVGFGWIRLNRNIILITRKENIYCLQLKFIQKGF